VTDPESSPLHRPRHRQYQEREYGRDVDAAERITRLRALTWSLVILIVAVPVGLVLGGFPWGVLGGLLAAAGVYVSSLTIMRGGAETFGMIHNPSGDVAPVKRDYSLAQSLAVRGDYEGALREYERAVLEFPDDPEPYVRIARIHRSELHAPEDALGWFKRARTDANVGPGLERVIAEEMIELYRTLPNPERAIPELARWLDRFPNDPGVASIRAELRALRQTVADQQRQLDEE
jgi:tetratricopeptide (TPR) repeat protein